MVTKRFVRADGIDSSNQLLCRYSQDAMDKSRTIMKSVAIKKKRQTKSNIIKRCKFNVWNVFSKRKSPERALGQGFISKIIRAYI